MNVRQLLILAAAVIVSMPGYASGPSFIPDAKFSGSSLTGWHTVGGASWHADNGSITGKAGAAPGWLMLDRSYQDTGFYAAFKCSGECDTGVLLRAEKTPEGIKGVLVSIKGNELKAYNVTLDAEGKELKRQELRLAGGQIRFAPPAPDPSAAPRPRPNSPPLPIAPAGMTLPVSRPVQGVRSGEWNDIEILLDADIVRAFLNNGGGQSSNATEEMDGYGAIALFVGENSEVTFKDIAYKDLVRKVIPAEQVGSRFRMQRINPYYYGWSAAVADFNHDGKLDIVSGPFIYYGPDFTTSSEIYPAQGYNTSTQYSTDDWVEHAYDFTGDGWPDVLTTSHADGGKVGAILYVNPGAETRRWKKYQVVAMVQSEETLLRDIDGCGKPELVYMAEGYVRYAKPDAANPTAPWTVHTISEKGPWPPHGIGVGDINGDGRPDILNAYGWWEQPPAGSGDQPWKYHPVAFSHWARATAGGAEIGVYDVNGDGLNDVVTSLQAHGWGLAWFEQKRAANGEITFVEHEVMGDYNAKNAGGVAFSEPHGSAIADVDGDGIPDFIIGKRYWSHLDDFFDPDPYGPALLYWYRTVRNPKAPGGAELVPELIHNWSGAGSDVRAVDLNGDGAIDIVTSTRSGTYIFWGKPGKAKKH